MKAQLNHRLLLFLLYKLEQSESGITTNQLCDDAEDAGFKQIELRQVQRYLKYFRDKNISQQSSRGVNILKKTEDRKNIFLVVRECFLSPDYSDIVYGDFIVNSAVRYFENVKEPVSLLYILSEAIRKSFLVSFNYLPQTEITRKKMQTHIFFENVSSRTKSIFVLPRYLVTSINSFLVLGEYWRKKSLTMGGYQKPECRQYELCGISNLELKEIERPTLVIDPQQLYQNSVYVWIGGQEYFLTLEEMSVDGKSFKQKHLKVNGESEILGYILSSMGKIRIVDPPDPIISRAQELNLPFDLIFRFTDKKS